MSEKIDNIKKEYSKFEKKYKLPSFQSLNYDFDVEKIAEKETELVLREMRKVIMDKVIAYLRFIEMLINPSNAPMFFIALAKYFTTEDKKTLESLYSKLGEFELNVIEIDNEYNEKEEAEFINNLYKDWQKIKKDMKKIVEALRRGWRTKSRKNEKGYLG